MPPAPFPLSGLADEAADDIDGQIAAHQALGWKALELRLLNGKQFSGPAASDDEFKQAIEIDPHFNEASEYLKVANEAKRNLQ